MVCGFGVADAVGLLGAGAGPEAQATVLAKSKTRRRTRLTLQSAGRVSKCVQEPFNGRFITNAAPPSDEGSRAIDPPCCRTIFFTIARPSPVPVLLVVK